MSEEPFVYIKDREVVYINAMKATKMTTEWRSNLGLIKEPDDVPLFLHPPRPEPARKPMTEDEMRKAWGQPGHLSTAVLIAYTRAIEKHHGILGGSNE